MLTSDVRIIHLNHNVNNTFFRIFDSYYSSYKMNPFVEWVS